MKWFLPGIYIYIFFWKTQLHFYVCQLAIDQSPRAYTAAFADLVASVTTTPLKDHIICLKQLIIALWLHGQDPLPGPRDPVEVDPALGDAELFEAAFLHLPSDGFEQMGDSWEDVT